MRAPLAVLAALLLSPPLLAAPPQGYYRQPAIHGSTIVFVAEGDLWKVSEAGGAATRITSHPGDEESPAISLDGATLAFTASYEGPVEIYTMPLTGGTPTRRTFGAGRRAEVAGWTPDGKILFRTHVHATLPARQLALLDVSGNRSGNYTLVPLAQADHGSYDDTGNVLYFTRFPFNGSHTRRYQGGMAQNVWRFSGHAEAGNLTADFAGTSKRPMWWDGRIYFASDRDQVMNLWSMLPDGTDPRQHTRHPVLEVRSPSLGSGKIVYQHGADLRLYDIASGEDRLVPITLDSDFDQTREQWIEKPMEYVSAAHVSPDGDRMVLTARGQVFVAPHRQGRLVEATRKEGVRYREARFLDDETLLVLSDESGEVELWTLPANGVGEGKQLTTDGEILRWEGVPSPDGKKVAHRDKLQRLFVYDLETGENRMIAEAEVDNLTDLAWSPDSRWLAYVEPTDNLFQVIQLHDTRTGATIQATGNRYDSYSPGWSPDGDWLYFLSDRHLVSEVRSPWGSYAPEPYLDRTTEIFHIPLVPGLRSPFDPKDELHEDGKEKSDTLDVAVTVDPDGIRERLRKVPVKPGNYGGLMVTGEALYWLSRPSGEDDRNLVGAKMARADVEVTTIAEAVSGVELSADGKKFFFRKKDTFHIVDAEPKKADLEKKDVDLSAWSLSVVPREEWRQMFVEAWRLERDYFYDRNLHGVYWDAVLATYLPLADRVTTRAELSDLISQMVAELSALHTYVYGGDMREGEDDVQVGYLGAELERDETAGGYRVTHIYASDPDEPERRSPFARPGVEIREGDLLTHLNGVPVLSVPHPGSLLRNQAGRQVLVRSRPGGGGEARDAIVIPLSASSFDDLRYHEWEYTRRLRVEEASDGRIGYVHLRAMGGGNFTEWAKGFYPAFTRAGLIVDVRNNRGGNIDSWILSRLIRTAWMYWNQTAGNAPVWNMQYAFRGHMVVLVNERTASDGEVFAEGFRRLGLGDVIGIRTWGGEIWLTSSNNLVDRGIATAAEFGVYGPEGEWLIEGHGVDPDVVVDNLPHATFQGEDAQLDAAIRHLEEKIAEEPVEAPVVPPFPDKSGN